MNDVLCKWISEDMRTKNDTYWTVNIPNELPEEDTLELCRKGLFHYVSDPLLAVFLKGYHNCNDYSSLYKVVDEGKSVEGIDKCGATKLTLVKELEIPEVTLNQKIAFAILCALEVYKEIRFVTWAKNWLSGQARSNKSVEVIKNFLVNARVATPFNDYRMCAFPYVEHAIFQDSICSAIYIAFGILDLHEAVKENYNYNYALKDVEWSICSSLSAAISAANPVPLLQSESALEYVKHRTRSINLKEMVRKAMEIK